MYLSQIQQNTLGFQSNRIEDPKLRMAAVAIIILYDDQQPGRNSVLLTLRTSKLNKHAGQYALPGGKLDADETAIEAAAREAHEELGIELPDENLLGTLDDYATRSGFVITPVMYWMPANTRLEPAPDEVERVFCIPFNELDSDAIPIFEDGVEASRPVLLSNFPSLGHRMYSPTASILYQFREVALRGQTTRVAHYDQPAFAWH